MFKYIKSNPWEVVFWAFIGLGCLFFLVLLGGMAGVVLMEFVSYFK